MNCYQHPEASAVAFCRNCGRALCTACQFPAEGTVFCYDHVPAPATATPPPAAYPVPTTFGPESLYGTTVTSPATNPYTSPIPPPASEIRTSPGLAFLLGLIPGVGAIYNGQYVKGLMHAVVFGLLASMSGNVHHGVGATFFGVLAAAFYFYMPFEAYHTARKRQLGITVDEWSSLLVTNRSGNRSAVGPALLIGLGILFLLDSLNVLPLDEMVRFWPLLLIAVGVIMLYLRLSTNASRSRGNQFGESFHEK